MPPLSAAVRRAALLCLPAAVLFWCLLALPGVCFSPQPSAKQAGDLAALHQAGLDRNRSQLPALLTALKKPNDPFERLSTLAALSHHGVGTRRK